MGADKYWLTEEEVRELTKKVKPSYQMSVLKEMGYTIRLRPDGTFVVPTDQFKTQETEKPSKEFELDFSALGDGQAA
jgi:hypothetical protein